MVSFKELVYVPEQGKFKPIDELNDDIKTLNISGTELRRLLYEGIEVPDWFSFQKYWKSFAKHYLHYQNADLLYFSQDFPDQENQQ